LEYDILRWVNALRLISSGAGIDLRDPLVVPGGLDGLLGLRECDIRTLQVVRAGMRLCDPLAGALPAHFVSNSGEVLRNAVVWGARSATECKAMADIVVPSSATAKLRFGKRSDCDDFIIDTRIKGRCSKRTG
jgi:hypothetical protein